MDESRENKANLSPPSQPPASADIDVLEKVNPVGGDSATEWVDNAVQQALIVPKTILGTLESAISATTSRLKQFKLTSSANLQMTFESLRDRKSAYNAYEDYLFGKIREGVFFAAANPFATSGIVVVSGFLAVKRSRRALYYKTLRLFLSEEAMLSRATAKVQKLRDSVKDITEEGKKLENFSLAAERELKRGRNKLRQAGKQIQGVISSAYKIERQSGGLKDILKELPKRDASQFRSAVCT
ncbi:hypothetical protein Ccrd_006777 [Cynara cardunculus var. scolymus]|uniref:Uncharacterized protein n=1 Tax=Cynara cardunculus var. scolymus TaxID=59895 RepID=A0A103XI51_CYNCS|nr:hypothetical protein Ccrd_006777 [Cynara cardunculus var. scolymus]